MRGRRGPPSWAHVVAVLLAALLLAAAAFPAAAAAAAAATEPAEAAWRHIVVIDAGSTGSRAHVFRWRPAARGSLPLVELPEPVHRSAPGLSSLAAAPGKVGEHLEPLLHFARRRVPPQQRATTPITLLATAGLRLLPRESADALLRAAGGVLASSGFAFDAKRGGARMLPGADEALMSWVALNYATGALQAATHQPGLAAASSLSPLGRKGADTAPPPPLLPARPLLGLLELGGASFQAAFVPVAAPVPPGEGANLTLPRLGAGRLWARSFEGLGLQAAAAAWGKRLAAANASRDPCAPRGYKPPPADKQQQQLLPPAAPATLEGSGDFGACRAGVAKLLPPASAKPGGGGGCAFKRCSLGGVFLPPPDGVAFQGLDNVAYAARALGLQQQQGERPLSIADYERAARRFCARPWGDVRAEAAARGGAAEEAYAPRACFAAALVVALLSDAMQLPSGAALVTASNAVPTPQRGRRVEVSWSVGAAVLAALDEVEASSAAASGGVAGGAAASAAAKSTPPSAAASAATAAPARRAHDHVWLDASKSTRAPSAVAGGRGAAAAASAAKLHTAVAGGAAVDADAGGGGLSDGAAALAAVAFCLAMLALSAVAHALGLGVVGGGGGSSVSSGFGPPSPLLASPAATGVAGLVAGAASVAVAAVGAAASAATGGSAGGAGPGPRFARLTARTPSPPPRGATGGSAGGAGNGAHHTRLSEPTSSGGAGGGKDGAALPSALASVVEVSASWLRAAELRGTAAANGGGGGGGSGGGGGAATAGSGGGAGGSSGVGPSSAAAATAAAATGARRPGTAPRARQR